MNLDKSVIIPVVSTPDYWRVAFILVSNSSIGELLIEFNVSLSSFTVSSVTSALFIKSLIYYLVVGVRYLASFNLFINSF